MCLDFVGLFTFLDIFTLFTFVGYTYLFENNLEFMFPAQAILKSDCEMLPASSQLWPTIYDKFLRITLNSFPWHLHKLTQVTGDTDYSVIACYSLGSVTAWCSISQTQGTLSSSENWIARVSQPYQTVTDIYMRNWNAGSHWITSIRVRTTEPTRWVSEHTLFHRLTLYVINTLLFKQIQFCQHRNHKASLVEMCLKEVMISMCSLYSELCLICKLQVRTSVLSGSWNTEAVCCLKRHLQ